MAIFCNFICDLAPLCFSSFRIATFLGQPKIEFSVNDMVNVLPDRESWSFGAKKGNKHIEEARHAIRLSSNGFDNLAQFCANIVSPTQNWRIFLMLAHTEPTCPARRQSVGIMPGARIPTSDTSNGEKRLSKSDCQQKSDCQNPRPNSFIFLKGAAAVL